ncbi:MAG: hypothetical protein VW362_09570 [Candidatus Nanopelagicales bacterium]
MIQSARLFEEYDMVVTKTVDRQDLPRGQGNVWNEIRLSQITAQGITETTVMENFSLYTDTLFSVTLRPASRTRRTAASAATSLPCLVVARSLL